MSPESMDGSLRDMGVRCKSKVSASVPRLRLDIHGDTESSPQ